MRRQVPIPVDMVRKSLKEDRSSLERLSVGNTIMMIEKFHKLNKTKKPSNKKKGK